MMNTPKAPNALTLKEKFKNSFRLILQAGANIGIILVLLTICAISNPSSIFSDEDKSVSVSPLFGSPTTVGTMMLQDAYLASHPNSPFNKYVNSHLWGNVNFLDSQQAATQALDPENKTTWTIGETGEGELSINLKPIANSDDVSIIVNNQEVVRLRETSDTLGSPMDQALQFASNLSRFIANKGDVNNIKVDTEADDSQTSVMAGHFVLLTVDQQAARRFNGKHRGIAFTWSNQIRKALGADRYIDPVLAESGNSQFEDFNPDELIATGNTLEGAASWYGPKFHGKHTASGSIFNMHEMTAAHKTLPFGTLVKVTFKKTGKHAIVRITDRGPYAHGRIIDLSKAAAKEIGLIGSGHGQVKLEILGHQSKIIAQKQNQPVAEGIKATPAATAPIPVSDPNTGGERLKEEPADIEIETKHLDLEKENNTQVKKRIQKHHSFLGRPAEESVEIYKVVPKNPAEDQLSESEPVS